MARPKEDIAMDIQEALYRYMCEHGISIAFVSAKTNIKYELLRRSLKCERVLSADDFVKIIKLLDIDLKCLEK